MNLGYFIKDFIAGRGIYKWNDGRIYLGEFKENEIHGNGKVIYPNGQVIEGIWENGKNRSVGQVHNREIPIVWSYLDPVSREQYDGKLSDVIIKPSHIQIE